MLSHGQKPHAPVRLAELQEPVGGRENTGPWGCSSEDTASERQRAPIGLLLDGSQWGQWEDGDGLEVGERGSGLGSDLSVFLVSDARHLALDLRFCLGRGELG